MAGTGGRQEERSPAEHCGNGIRTIIYESETRLLVGGLARVSLEARELPLSAPKWRERDAGRRG